MLVTGASGLLGGTVIQVWRERATCLAVSHRHPLRGVGFASATADLTVRDEARALVESFRPEWIVHCAALTDVDRCEREPAEAERVNVMAAGHLAEAAAASGARLLHVSTDAVYDGVKGGFVENDATGPVNRYAESKLRGEAAVLARQPDALIVRANLFGWNPRDKRGLAEWMLDRLQRGEVVPGFDDVIFNPLLTTDLAELFGEMLGRGLTGVVHAGSADAISKYHFGVLLAEAFSLDPRLVRPVPLASAGLPTPRPRNTSLRTARLESLLGRSMPRVAEGLQKFRAQFLSGSVTELKSLGRG